MQQLCGGPPVPIGKPIEHSSETSTYILAGHLLNSDKYWGKYSLQPQPPHPNQDFTQTLPNELLSDIFCFVCFGSTDRAKLTMPGYQTRVESGRSLVCQIASRWRKVALSTPSLWASIYIPYWEPRLPLLQLWLERSCRYPLSLTMEVEPRGRTEAENLRRIQYFNDVTSLLLIERYRWRHIFFEFQDSHPGIQFLANADIASIGTLESASLMLPRTKGEDKNIEEQVFGAVSSLPRLRHFAWKTSRGLSSSITSPAWSKLTDITLGTRISTDDCVRFLAACHSASSVIIKEIDRNLGDDFEWRTDQIVLPFLQSLYLAETKGDMTVVIDHFTMPSLKHLRMCTAIKEGGFGRLERFLLRSACSLQCLVMHGWRMSEESMLTHLRISAMGSIGWVKFKSIFSDPYGFEAVALAQPGISRGQPCYHDFLPALYCT